jgi:hypothetical protein
MYATQDELATLHAQVVTHEHLPKLVEECSLNAWVISRKTRTPLPTVFAYLVHHCLETTTLAHTQNRDTPSAGTY